MEPLPFRSMRRCATDPSSQHRPMSPAAGLVTPHSPLNIPRSPPHTTSSEFGTVADARWAPVARPATGSIARVPGRLLVRQFTVPICCGRVLRSHRNFDVGAVGSAPVEWGEREPANSSGDEFNCPAGNFEEMPITLSAEAEAEEWRRAARIIDEQTILQGSIEDYGPFPELEVTPRSRTGTGISPLHNETNSTPPSTTSPIPPPEIIGGDRGVAGKKGPPATKQGTCIVCLISDVQVLDADWLHEQGEGSRTSQNDSRNHAENRSAAGERCQVSACLECLKTYFEGIVLSGFDGACPRMRCMSCPRTVPEKAWGALVNIDVLDMFRHRAATLLSIQCGDCHSRGDIMVIPPAHHSYSDAMNTLFSSIESQSNDAEECSTKLSAESVSALKGTAVNAAELKEFRRALERYSAGNGLEVPEFYEDVARCVSPGTAKNPQARMTDVLLCIEDSERRASLYLRFLKFHHVVLSRCCEHPQCFRCRTADAHDGMTCEQKEAQRGFDEVLICPGCGVYMVKGDGCDAITCVCGTNFNWYELLEAKELEAADVFCAAHPSNPGRAAAEILRRSDSSSGPAADGIWYEDMEHGNYNAGTDDDRPHEDEEVGTATTAQEILPPVPEPVAHPEEDALVRVPEPNVTDIVEPLSQEQLRLARIFARLHVEDFRRARAAIYAEENRNFTAERAFLDVHGPVCTASAVFMHGGPGRDPPGDRFLVGGRGGAGRGPERGCGGRGQPNLAARRQYGPGQLQWSWTFRAAQDWLYVNRAEAEAVGRRNEAMRFALVEALYGSNNVIEFVAAEHARGALRHARANRADMPLFHNLDLFQPNEDASPAAPAVPGEETGNGRQQASVSPVPTPAPPPPLPSPEILWSLAPRLNFRRRGEYSRAGETLPPSEPTARVSSAVANFGPLRMGDHVAAWLSSSPARQARLRSAMAGEEQRLAGAWAALWGLRQRRLMASRRWSEVQRTTGDVNGGCADRDASAVIAAAARRVAFLEVYPEQACREQGPMMKAFSTVHGDAVARAREDATVQRALDFERIHAGAAGVATSDWSGQDVANVSPEKMLHVYNASIVEQKNQSGKSAAVASEGREVATRSFGERRMQRMAEAWERCNRKRVTACLFEKTYGEKAAFSAALATVAGSGGVMTCACGLEGVVSDAAVWASYNVQEFEKAMVEVKRKIEATNDEEGEGEGTAVDSGEIVQCRGCGRSHEICRTNWCRTCTYEMLGVTMTEDICVCEDGVLREQTDDRMLLFG